MSSLLFDKQKGSFFEQKKFKGINHIFLDQAHQ